MLELQSTKNEFLNVHIPKIFSANGKTTNKLVNRYRMGTSLRTA